MRKKHKILITHNWIPAFAGMTHGKISRIVVMPVETGIQ
jgi:hypothetical protein